MRTTRPSEMSEKYCSTCRRLLPIDEYYYSNRYKRHQSVCKGCVKKAAAARLAALRKSPEYRRKENERWMRRYNTDEEFRARDNERSAERMRRIRAKAKADAAAQVCRNCWLYPCFEGIDSMESNLALTCRSWRHRKAVKNAP